MAEKRVYAKSKYVRMAPQKARLVVDMVRGENAVYASEMLDFVNKAAAVPVKKTIESAIANAENNEEMDKKELKIVEARVDDAPIYKRGRAVSKGRYHKILKRNSHIIIAVAGDDKKVSTKAKEADSKEKIKESETKKKIRKVEATDVTEISSEKPIEKKRASGAVKKKQVKQAQVKSTGTQRKVQAKG
ncbi:50S ribosomal protein L22 [Candidatus Dojkabacteria bacterium]|nr:50S ribosomal protein L22 [Candidatus Dojkabacteria bacterium]